MGNTDNIGHAELGASNSHRWIPCPGSVRLSRGIPNTESEYSRAGTAAHKVAEMCLRKDVDPEMWEGMTIEGVEITPEMVESVRIYADHCRQVIKMIKGFQAAGGVSQYWIEHKFSLAKLNPPGPMFGTSDFCWYDPLEKILHVVDYKNGSGVVVEVAGNVQLRYYALGVTLEHPELEIEQVYVWIIQPNAPHTEGVVRYDKIDYLDLLAFAGTLMDAARATLDPNAPLVAGSHCKFCPAAANCPELRNRTQVIAQTAFDVMPAQQPPAPETLSNEQLGRLLPLIPIVEGWGEAVRAEAYRRAKEGEEIPDHKIVEKQPRRHWVSPAQVERWLKEEKGLDDSDIFKQTLKSPAQIEKIVGKKELPAEFVDKRSSGHTLAPIHDNRPAVSLNPADAFPALPPGGE